VFRPKYTDPQTGEKRESPTYWYEFVFRGKRYRERAGVTNKREAEQIEAARKTQLAEGEVGILDRGTAPTLEQFEPRFNSAIETEKGDKPATAHSTKRNTGGFSTMRH
jgi:hypothetical protein